MAARRSLNGGKEAFTPYMDVPQGTLSCAKRNSPCMASECNEFVSAGGHVPPKQLKQKADKKVGKPFGRLEAARRVKAMDGLNQTFCGFIKLL